MKKVLVLGLLAIAASAFTQQQASAWVNSRLGVGFNWDYQAGGNALAWGLWRNNQPGGGDPLPHHMYKSGYGAPMPAPMYVPAPGPKMIVPGAAPVLIPDAHHGSAVPMNPTHAYYPGYGYVSPYHFATYPRPVYYYYHPTYAR